jgi:hypothetical protein
MGYQPATPGPVRAARFLLRAGRGLGGRAVDGCGEVVSVRVAASLIDASFPAGV